jgi:Methyltransferase domain
MILGDSGEYEVLAQGVELSKEIPGILCEVGVREGMGTKFIIDAAVIHRPGSTVIGIDPYGSIMYKPRDHMPECRLDYTNDMYKQLMADMSAYVLDKNVNWRLFKMTDNLFFHLFGNGITNYDLEPTVMEHYSFVHLDGPHSVEAVNHEIDWFAERMLPGAILCIDDITPDFIPLEQVEEHMGINDENGRFERVLKGLKKAMYLRR